MMPYELVRIDEYGHYFAAATFQDKEDIEDEINRLDAALEEASVAESWRIQSTIYELQELLSSIEQ